MKNMVKYREFNSGEEANEEKDMRFGDSYGVFSYRLS